MKRLLKKMIRRINVYREKLYLFRLRRRNRNKRPTIVANNCIAGVIYHNLGLEFTSPTINLYILGGDYIEFVKNFGYYRDCRLVEERNTEFKFPVGRLVANDSRHRDITVYFMHYPSFEDAKQKWEERYRRADFNNVYFLWEFHEEECGVELLREFDALSGKRTLAITHRKIEGLKHSATVNCYKDGDPTGKILERNIRTGKRYLEQVDYVRFLNEGR